MSNILDRLNREVEKWTFDTISDTGLEKIGARSCRGPNMHQTTIEGGRKIVHQHYFSWQSIYSTPSSRLYGHKQN